MKTFSYQLYSSRKFSPLGETLELVVRHGYGQVEGFRRTLAGGRNSLTTGGAQLWLATMTLNLRRYRMVLILKIASLRITRTSCGKLTLRCAAAATLRSGLSVSGIGFKAVHVKDIAVAGQKADKGSWADVGESVMDWKGLFQQSVIGFGWLGEWPTGFVLHYGTR